MTDYANIADILAKYAPIKTQIGSGDGLYTSADVTSRFIPDAQAIIDGYLARRYEVPLSFKAPLVTTITCDLSIFNMMVECLPQVPDFMKDRYNRAIKLLEAIASGTILIQSATVLTSDASDSFVYSSTSGYHPIFSPVLRDIDQAPDVDRQIADRDARLDDYDI